MAVYYLSPAFVVCTYVLVGSVSFFLICYLAQLAVPTQESSTVECRHNRPLPAKLARTPLLVAIKAEAER